MCISDLDNEAGLYEQDVAQSLKTEVGKVGL